jgi:hypothetical protein
VLTHSARGGVLGVVGVTVLFEVINNSKGLALMELLLLEVLKGALLQLV